jgi:hypothetical protein
MLAIHCSQAHYSHNNCVAQQANEVVTDKGMKHVNPNLSRQNPLLAFKEGFITICVHSWKESLQAGWVLNGSKVNLGVVA